MLTSLCYVSSATRLMSNQELLEILRSSRQNNRATSVTGMLLYKGGNFMQVIEGPRESIQSLMEIINKDIRHKDIFMLWEEEIETRQFATWEMAFANLDSDEIKNEPHYSQFLQDELTAAKYRHEPRLAYTMLLSFRDSLR